MHGASRKGSLWKQYTCVQARAHKHAHNEQLQMFKLQNNLRKRDLSGMKAGNLYHLILANKPLKSLPLKSLITHKNS